MQNKKNITAIKACNEICFAQTVKQTPPKQQLMLRRVSGICLKLGIDGIHKLPLLAILYALLPELLPLLSILYASDFSSGHYWLHELCS